MTETLGFNMVFLCLATRPILHILKSVGMERLSERPKRSALVVWCSIVLEVLLSFYKPRRKTLHCFSARGPGVGLVRDTFAAGTLLFTKADKTR